jgi:hypothetical protein
MKCYLELGDPGEHDREPVVGRIDEVRKALEAWFEGLA